ncbi:type II toxin-antitoxin system VapC family toxin [bacterium]|nr:type II toxin-antitoxin system VapC family toxin [bacterium]
MAQKALIDSCICIDYLRGVQAAIYYLDEMRDKGWLRCSAVTYAELLAGCRNRREEQAVSRFISRFEVEPVTAEDSLNAIRLLKKHRFKNGLGWLDCLVACAALRLHLPIATLNEKHLQPISGVKTICPY